MEAKHDLLTGVTELVLSDEDLERFRTLGELSAVHPYTGKRVDVFKISMMHNYSLDKPLHYPPFVNFGSDGLLNVAIPMRHGETLDLPLSIPAEAIQRGHFTEKVFGELGSIVLLEASQLESE